MATRVKLLDVDLIRTFGSAFVNMDDNQAKKYIDLGKAKFIETVVNDSLRNTKEPVSQDKAKWSPPESKLFTQDQKKSDNTKAIYPGPDDVLFTQIQ